MAGEPILVASNCAVVSVIEPLVLGAAPSETSVDFGMMTLLAQAIDAPILQLIGETDFVVDCLSQQLQREKSGGAGFKPAPPKSRVQFWRAGKGQGVPVPMCLDAPNAKPFIWNIQCAQFSIASMKLFRLPRVYMNERMPGPRCRTAPARVLHQLQRRQAARLGC